MTHRKIFYLFILMGHLSLPFRVGGITLDEAVSLALAQNPEILMAESGIERARGGVVSSRSQFFPKLSAQGNYTRLSRVSSFGGRGFGEENNYLGQLILEQPLFTWGRTQNAYRIAKLDLRSKEENLRMVKGDVVFRVKEAFYRILLLREFLILVEESSLQMDRHAKTVSIRYREGLSSRFDLIRANVESANLKPQVIRAKNQLDMAGIVLKNLLGVDHESPLEIAGELTFEPIELDPLEILMGEARKNRSEIQSLSLRKEMGERSLSVAKAGNKPTLSALGRFNYRNPFDFQDQWGSDGDLTLALTLPLFDGFATQGEVRRAKAQLLETSFAFESLEDLVEMEVEETSLKLKEVEEILITHRERVKEAEEGLEIAERQYENGVLTNLEFLDSQLALSRAKTNYLQAMNDYLVYNALMEKVLGR